MADVDARRRHLGQAQHLGEQAQDLDVGLDAGVAVELGAELQRLAGASERGRQRVQHAAAVAQARHAAAVEQVGVDARDLRRHVGAHAHAAAGELVDQLEGAQLEVLAGAGGERVEVLEQRRDHELVAAQPEGVEQTAAQALQPVGVGRQGVLDVVGQYPAHGDVRER